MALPRAATGHSVRTAHERKRPAGSHAAPKPGAPFSPLQKGEVQTAILSTSQDKVSYQIVVRRSGTPLTPSPSPTLTRGEGRRHRSRPIPLLPGVGEGTGG